MNLFSLDSVILIMVTCNFLPFSYSQSIFRRHISWVLKIVFRSIFWGGYPQTPLVLSALWCSPVGKKPSYGPGNLFIFFEFVHSVPSFVFVVLFTPSSNVLSRYSYPSLSLVAALTRSPFSLFEFCRINFVPAKLLMNLANQLIPGRNN